MKLENFLTLIKDKKPVVRFNKKINNFETGFDFGMMACASSYQYCHLDTVIVSFEFSEFEEYNKKYEQADWLDKDGNPRLRWSETKYYPQNKIEDICFTLENDIDCLEIVENFDTKEVRALRWTVKQLEKILAGEKAEELVECLEFARLVLNEFPQNKGDQ